MAIFRKWELDCAIIGETDSSTRLRLRENGATAADIPVPPLVANAPEYDRPWTPSPPAPVLSSVDVPPPDNIGTALLQLMGSPDLASRRWIWEQYDSQVMADTVCGPGGDAAVVRGHGTTKALALTTDCTPRC